MLFFMNNVKRRPMRRMPESVLIATSEGIRPVWDGWSRNRWTETLVWLMEIKVFMFPRIVSDVSDVSTLLSLISGQVLLLNVCSLFY